MVKRKNRNRKQKRRRQEAFGTQEGIAVTPMHNRSPLQTDWAGPDGAIGVYIAKESKKTLEGYRSQPNWVDEHANHEEDTARGGYAHRQLFELVQNGADALAGSSGGRIWIRLTPTHLYCADEGQPIDSDGVRALMFSHLSPKRGTEEIGRFGFQVGAGRNRHARILQPLRIFPIRPRESSRAHTTCCTECRAFSSSPPAESYRPLAGDGS